MAISLRPWLGTFAAVFTLAGAGLAQYAPPPVPPPAAKPPATEPAKTVQYGLPPLGTPTNDSKPSAIALPADMPPGQPQVVDLTPPEFAHHAPTTHTCDGCGTCDTPAEWLFSAEYLFVRPRRRPDDFAIVDPADNLAPEGNIKSAGFNMSSGVRAAIGYKAANNPWETWFTYTYIKGDGGNSAAAPPGGVIYPTLTRPGLVDTALFGQASSNLTYNLYDLDAVRRVAGDNSFNLRLLLGTRYATIDQDLAATYFGRDANGTRVQSRVEFDGVGPTVGGEARWLLPWGFQFFGRAKGGLIIGEVTNTLRETDNGGATTNANVRECYYTNIPMLEMGTGISWEYRNFRLSVGYEVVNWFNLIDSPTFVDDFAEGKIGRRHGDLSLEGLFVQLGVAY
jgi:hypothetical protein